MEDALELASERDEDILKMLLIAPDSKLRAWTLAGVFGDRSRKRDRDRFILFVIICQLLDPYTRFEIQVAGRPIAALAEILDSLRLPRPTIAPLD